MFILDTLGEWFKGLLSDGIIANFTGMFDEVNREVANIAGQVGATPESWNSSIFGLIRTLSETVVIPIAGVILTFVLCYELISMVIERNNMADFEPATLYKWIFKTFVAVFILTHTFDIVMAVFDVGQHIVNKSAGVIKGSLDAGVALAELEKQLAVMGIGELIGLYIESTILSFAMKAMSICVFLIIYGRMIEIYMTCSIAPVPFSTFVNREWGHIGNGYLKSLFALAFQGFLIMVCVAIYAILLQTITASGSIHENIWKCAGISVLLIFTMFKSGGLAKSLLAAH
jgi:hypothetical protein